jgi:hypothetical protein
MTTLIAYHEVDDRDHWLNSTKREEIMGPLGISVRTFADPGNPNRVALLAEVPDMAAFQAMMESDEVAAAMAHDGVRPETLVILLET